MTAQGTPDSRTRTPHSETSVPQSIHVAGVALVIAKAEKATRNLAIIPVSPLYSWVIRSQPELTLSGSRALTRSPLALRGREFVIHLYSNLALPPSP